MMKTKSMLLSLIAAGVMASVPAAYGAGLVKDCKKELKKFGCDMSTDAAANECLEQHEVQGKKNEGFSHQCHKAHEKYMKKMGELDKNDQHISQSTDQAQKSQ